MTRKIALIAGLFVFTFMPMQAARKLTKISFDKLTYDFGTIYEKDGNATCTFRLSMREKRRWLFFGRKPHAVAPFPLIPNILSHRAIPPK